MAKQYYCFLKKFNNYFNRKIIVKDDIDGYVNASDDYYIPKDAQNNWLPFDFNPNDNITTEIICNDVPFDPDYFLILDNNNDIVSRWFVLEQKRNRQGQWLYFLRRDVIADSYEQLNIAPVYIERGIINDFESPLLLNNEDLRVNQIKKKEILLKDKTNCAWLVLYLKKGVLGNNKVGPDGNGEITIDIPVENETFVYEELTTPITAWQYYQHQTTPLKVANSQSFYAYYDQGLGCHVYKVKNANDSTIASTGGYNYHTGLGIPLEIQGGPNVNQQKTLLDAEFKPHLSTLRTTANTVFGYSATDPLSQYDGKIIKDSQGKYFKVTVSKSSSNVWPYVTSAQSSLKALMSNYWNTALSQSDTPNDKAFRVYIEFTSILITLEELKHLQTTVDLGSYTGKGTKDSALFDAICLPYGDLNMFIGTEVSVDTHATAEKSLAIMNSLATALTSQNVLDLQILPYCPCQNLVNEDYYQEGGIYVPEDDAGEVIRAIHAGDITDFLLVCHSMNITLDIAQTIDITISEDVPQTYKTKYLNDCTMIRLCSPNYNGLFEMNLAKNGGNITSFNVDITLRPFNPYIHINPDFNYVYGQDFNDVRGLICNGDFSLGIINDAWNVYEIQNKNYQAIFDRQIQNMEVNNAINMQEATWGAIAGTVQGAGYGAIAGGVATKSPYGAIAGAVIGGVTSGIGGALDVQNLEKRQAEARSYAVDNYNLQLGNIRALPNSITKTSALTYNNKLFPFVEIYECTDTEREAYFNKIKYNGMSVRIIDTITNYISGDASNYFRGRLIRMTNLGETNKFLETINDELLKGVYI